ncbi:unnamed protein product [Blepharisma stoltei]|uniref:Uncharacterized protein n=1 Tax=Blepharisma stoltei TaxID=1481888 RepID=A0AAU9IBQ2_9CILI|nr:unnamed protein product [Blepharisma stoltei]
MEPEKTETSEKQNSDHFRSEKYSMDSFDVLGTLGVGTFSRVRLVRSKDQSHMKPLALKILKKTSILKMRQIKHLRNEKEIMEQLDHSFITKILGTFQDDYYVFFVLEYACGGELFTRMKKLGTFPAQDAQFYIAELVLALEYLHDKGIVFRDLKPENILIDRLGHIKLSDFGFAKAISDGKTYTMCGTPEYLAPEIILGKGHGREVDWWALGVLLYEMLAGYPPYYDDSPFNIYQKILLGRLIFPPHFDDVICSLISGLLEPSIQKRIGYKQNAASELKNHAWFSNIDFSSLLAKECASPWVPELMSEDDTSNFNTYPDSLDQPHAPKFTRDRDPFIGF